MGACFLHNSDTYVRPKIIYRQLADIELLFKRDADGEIAHSLSIKVFSEKVQIYSIMQEREK